MSASTLTERAASFNSDIVRARSVEERGSLPSNARVEPSWSAAEFSLPSSQFSPFSTVFLYLPPFGPPLCVSPAARNGSRDMPVAAIWSVEDPSNFHDPSFCCIRPPPRHAARSAGPTRRGATIRKQIR